MQNQGAITANLGMVTLPHATRPTVVIAGAGLVGLWLARALLEKKCKVHMIDRSQAASGASWAAAGMLAPQLETLVAVDACQGELSSVASDENDGWPEHFEQMVAARAHCQAWIQDLCSGLAEQEVGLKQSGSLYLAMSDISGPSLHRCVTKQQERGQAAQWLSTEQLPEEVRAQLNLRSVFGGALMPADVHVEPRLLAQRLLAWLRAQNDFRLDETTELRSPVVRANRCMGVMVKKHGHCEEEMIEADATVIAMGAWSPLISSFFPALRAIEPVHGQLLLAQCAELAISTIVAGAGFYVVPRGTGQFLIGTTMTRQGYRIAVEEHVTESLLQTASNVLPALRRAHVLSAWSGLRPFAPEPIETEGAIGGLYASAGHHRNGVLRATMAAERLASLVASKL
jgi:glycine oxidase